MRYTEARLGPLATEMLRDIDADTVDFGPNYDESTREPLLLPARFPNLLVNGAAGIAVGMATNIPPHNLREVAAAVNAYIDDPEIDMKGLMKHVKGPDFPGGGTIMGGEGIRDAYRSGRGSIKVRAKAHVEPLKGGKEAIIVTELPFQVKKGGEGGLITKIADLVREKKITGISDLRDESDRSGMRIVIELKRGGDPATVVLNQLYKRTADAAELRHQHGRAGRRRAADAEPAGDDPPLRRPPAGGHHPAHAAPARPGRVARPHPRGAADRARQARRGDQADPRLEGPRRRPRQADARSSSSRRPQAQAILDMRLQRLTALEADKIKEEHAELVKEIKQLRAILADETKVLGPGQGASWPRSSSATATSGAPRSAPPRARSTSRT